MRHDTTNYCGRADLVVVRLTNVVYSEKQRHYPSFWLHRRHVTVGLDFWPCTRRSSILVTGAEHRWFDFEDPVLSIAECVVEGLIGPAEPPEMTFERYVRTADHAMRSILAGSHSVELRGDSSTDNQVLWNDEHVGVSLVLVSKRSRASRGPSSILRLPPPPAMDDFLMPGSAVRFGAYLATVFKQPRRL